MFENLRLSLWWIKYRVVFNSVLLRNISGRIGKIIDAMIDAARSFCVSYSKVMVRFPVFSMSQPLAKAFTFR